jgi:hypothetical protein
MEGLGHAEGVEACRPFVGDSMARYAVTLAEVVDDGGIAAARTHYGMAYAVSHEQSRELVDTFLTAIHLIIFTI